MFFIFSLEYSPVFSNLVQHTTLTEEVCFENVSISWNSTVGTLFWHWLPFYKWRWIPVEISLPQICDLISFCVIRNNGKHTKRNLQNIRWWIATGLTPVPLIPVCVCGRSFITNTYCSSFGWRILFYSLFLRNFNIYSRLSLEKIYCVYYKF